MPIKSVYDLDVMQYNKKRDANCDTLRGKNMKNKTFQ